MTAEQRAAFDRDGYLVIRGALSAAEVEHYEKAIDWVYARQAEAGRLGPDGSMHLLSAVANCPDMADLVDHPSGFSYVWSILGWNVHIYHSHLDVHPTIEVQKPFRFEWHQDGGRQNREIETSPRPRLSVKLAYWLSDVSEPGRGNFKVVPGSHLTDWIDGPPRRDVQWPDPDGAIEVTARPGDAVFFDRRIWHTRSNNYSAITRKGAFFAYTYRWTVGRDDPVAAAGLTQVQQQLLDLIDTSGEHMWGHYPKTTPVHEYLSANGWLNPAHPPLKP